MWASCFSAVLPCQQFCCVWFCVSEPHSSCNCKDLLCFACHSEDVSLNAITSTGVQSELESDWSCFGWNTQANKEGTITAYYMWKELFLYPVSGTICVRIPPKCVLSGFLLLPCRLWIHCYATFFNTLSENLFSNTHFCSVISMISVSPVLQSFIPGLLEKWNIILPKMGLCGIISFYISTELLKEVFFVPGN